MKKTDSAATKKPKISFRPFEMKDGKWYVQNFHSGNYYPNSGCDTEAKTLVLCMQKEAQMLQLRMDEIHTWLEDNDPEFNFSDPHGYLC